jgi:hypothetical protein
MLISPFLSLSLESMRSSSTIEARLAHTLVAITEAACWLRCGHSRQMRRPALNSGKSLGDCPDAVLAKALRRLARPAYGKV